MSKRPLNQASRTITHTLLNHITNATDKIYTYERRLCKYLHDLYSNTHENHRSFYSHLHALPLARKIQNLYVHTHVRMYVTSMAQYLHVCPSGCPNCPLARSNQDTHLSFRAMVSHCWRLGLRLSLLAISAMTRMSPSSKAWLCDIDKGANNTYLVAGISVRMLGTHTALCICKYVVWSCVSDCVVSCK